MKKILLVAVALLGLTVNAQDKKESKGLEGVWWAAGQVSFDSSKTGSANFTEFEIKNLHIVQ